MQNLIAVLMLIAAANAQIKTGFSQVGDMCQWDNDCANWKIGACCVAGQDVCSSDNGWTDANGNNFEKCKGTATFNKDDGPMGEKPTGTSEPEEKNNSWVWIVLTIILASAAIGGGYYYYTTTQA